MIQQKIQVKCNHLLKILRRKSNKDDTYFLQKNLGKTPYLRAISRSRATLSKIKNQLHGNWYFLELFSITAIWIRTHKNRSTNFPIKQERVLVEMNPWDTYLYKYFVNYWNPPTLPPNTFYFLLLLELGLRFLYEMEADLPIIFEILWSDFFLRDILYTHETKGI